ncbi:aminoacyl-tRNA hydrolase [Sphingorhabdus sp. M41]|uniref:aminoacyl-tRNA hydrolase n=1 Tax=Sphingorhabdus sp. M41 TaxID=1806885 RepID=UPI00078E1BE1|nr:aminoacyl-tRNA hydrolase [Sphingorhabdus sp. M41]AMO71648.1 peptidyl-tRNA hydrolase [Sphingorhabdus sp. M41]
MQLWVGLGNPGAQYAMHRHNVGFMVIDALEEVHGFPPPKQKFKGWTMEARLGGEKLVLLKPATFMNESGQSVRAALDFYKLQPEDVTVFYDELDLEPFRIKVKRGGGAAGHNGIRSMIAHIGPDFRRVRIGIGHPGHKARVTGHVLGNYAKSEIDDLADMLGIIAAEADWLAKNDDARFMSEVAMRMQE